MLAMENNPPSFKTTKQKLFALKCMPQLCNTLDGVANLFHTKKYQTFTQSKQTFE